MLSIERRTLQDDITVDTGVCTFEHLQLFMRLYIGVHKIMRVRAHTHARIRCVNRSFGLLITISDFYSLILTL